MESAFKLQHATTAVNAGALTKLIAFCGGAVMRRAGSTAADYKLVAERRGRPCKRSSTSTTHRDPARRPEVTVIESVRQVDKPYGS